MSIVDIVIVTYNSEDTIKRCLLDSYSDLFNYIIIDNNSTDSTVDQITSLGLSNLVLIANSTNYGLAVANNMCISYLRSDYTLILNPDTFISRRSILHMVNYLGDNPNVAAIGPCTTSSDSLSSVESISCGQSYGKFFSFTDCLYSLFIPEMIKLACFSSDITNPISVDWLSGHCILVRSSVFISVGGYDTNFFLSICDVVDLCKRIRDVQYDILFHPSIHCIHIGAVSSRIQAVKPFSYFRSVQGLIYFISKWYGSRFAVLTQLMFICFLVIKIFFLLPLSLLHRRFRSTLSIHYKTLLLMLSN